MKKYKTCLVIPSYNCAEQLNNIFSGVSPEDLQLFEKVIFIDNQSTDSSWEVISNLKSKINHAYAKQNSTNIGLGGSFKIAYNLTLKHQCDCFCFFHGDNQADITDAINIQRKILSTGLQESILGARFHPEATVLDYSKKRHIGNIYFNKFFSLLLKTTVHDIGSGLNFYRVRDLEPFVSQLSNNIAFDVRILLELFGQKNPPKFIPICWRGSRKTSTTNLSVTLLIFYELFRFYSRNFRVKLSKARVPSGAVTDSAQD